jgi:Rrf2 family protein
MADIAKHGNGNPVPLKDVAGRQDLSKLYLSQLATPLRNAALLRSVWGNKGGYVLARPADQINLLEIMEAVDGPVSIIECVQAPGSCERAEMCESINVWRNINDAVTKTLKQYTLKDLADSEVAKGGANLLCLPKRKR